MKILSLKTVIKSDNWIITEVLQGNDSYRINAKRRFPIADDKNFFSKWGKKNYIERLIKEYYNKKCSELSLYKY